MFDMRTHPLKDYRIKKGLTQEQIADLLGISVASVCRIENGSQNITPALAVIVEEIIGIDRLILLYPDSEQKTAPAPKVDAV